VYAASRAHASFIGENDAAACTAVPSSDRAGGFVLNSAALGPALSHTGTRDAVLAAPCPALERLARRELRVFRDGNGGETVDVHGGE
jgi:hypothetical protein